MSLKQLDNWKQVELFQREAEVLKKLDHPQIPKYLDYFDIETTTDKFFYIVQELAPGRSLADLVEFGWRSNEAEVKNIAKQVLNILKYLHSLDPPVVHRDLKPNNLIRSDDGKIYLVDFGAVQHTYYNTLMQGSTVVGTYGYMAPEQFRGKALSATDLYSLGATILFLLTHRSPSELPQDTLKLDFRSSVNISESFADWLEKILEPDIEDRFSSADVALKELLSSEKVKQRNILKGLGVGALCLTLAWGFTSYKWVFLSYFGYYPAGVCSGINSLKSIDSPNKNNKQDSLITINKEKTRKILINCVIESYLLSREEKRWIVQVLTRKGVDVNSTNHRGETPIFFAASSHFKTPDPQSDLPIDQSVIDNLRKEFRHVSPDIENPNTVRLH